jgi:hypothetical protein
MEIGRYFIGAQKKFERNTFRKLQIERLKNLYPLHEIFNVKRCDFMGRTLGSHRVKYLLENPRSGDGGQPR